MSLIQIIYLHHQMKGDWIAVPGSFGGMPLGQYYGILFVFGFFRSVNIFF
jgi:hypothetical protein